ncbi:Cupin domain protein [compost metagenome]
MAHTRTALHRSAQDQNATMGIWECSPGQFRRQVMEAEYSYIISGEGSFTPDGGESIEFRAGDALYFPANTEGTWDIRQALRKTYLIFG